MIARCAYEARRFTYLGCDTLPPQKRRPFHFHARHQRPRPTAKLLDAMMIAFILGSPRITSAYRTRQLPDKKFSPTISASPEMINILFVDYFHILATTIAVSTNKRPAYYFFRAFALRFDNAGRYCISRRRHHQPR